jgi:pimeloyl-ACP methyl ester carboxylesterase
MRSDEVRDAGALTGTALGDIADLARDVHTAAAGRLFGLLERAAPVTRPIRYLHDGIAAVAYTSTSLGIRYLPRAAGVLAAEFHDPTAESAHDSRRGRLVLGAVNGFWGDHIKCEQESLAPLLRLRLHDGPLRRIPANVAHDADDSITGRLVVFTHGLCETDLCWSYAAEKRWGDRTCTYGSMLRERDGWTPIYANYNTGVHLSENGRELAEQLEELVDAWPLPVTEIAMVGHSLGGLVARSAAHQAHEQGYRWAEPLRHIVGLGTPHLGAPLERFANWGTHRLTRLPETRPFAEWLNRRSVGIKDLRYGALLEADWLDHDPDELLADHCTEAFLIPGVTYSMACATLSRQPEGWLAHDLLVQHSSAHGIGDLRSIPFDPDRAFHLGGRKHHFDLLAHPTVYDTLRGWLAGGDGAGRSAENTDETRRVNRRTGRVRRARRTS